MNTGLIPIKKRKKSNSNCRKLIKRGPFIQMPINFTISHIDNFIDRPGVSHQILWLGGDEPDGYPIFFWVEGNDQVPYKKRLFNALQKQMRRYNLAFDPNMNVSSITNPPFLRKIWIRARPIYNEMVGNKRRDNFYDYDDARSYLRLFFDDKPICPERK